MRQPIAVWLVVAVMTMAAPVAAQEMVGIFEGWGAFRADAQCYAIARPERIAGPQRSTASAGFSHRRSEPARFFARLSRARRPGRPWPSGAWPGPFLWRRPRRGARGPP